MKTTLLLLCLVILAECSHAGCTPLGDETTYGTSNTWIGYVYQGKSFNTYKGYVNEGSAASPNFDESFGGQQVNYTTNGCPVYTDTFSVRYKLTSAIPDGDYIFVVGGDDGYRLSLDGGSTYVINQWNDQGYGTTTYSVHLNGTYNLVLEYYENMGDNRISFNMTKSCTGSGDPTVYGTNNKWIGYVYTGTSFNSYKGYVSEGTAVSPNFDEGFGGDVVTYNTSDCPITTTQFSVRYRLQSSLSNGTYTITVGGDDGYRLSLDGGATYVINNWNDQSYNTSTYTAILNGTYNMVLEYYENSGQNRVSFSMSGGTILPVTISSFTGAFEENHTVNLEWKTMMEAQIDHYEIERSEDGANFQYLASQNSKQNDSTHDYELAYDYTDTYPLSGTSYYRLRIVGKDGAMNYSAIVHVSNSQPAGIKIYPTVVQNSNLFIESGKTLKNARLEFFDLSGKKLGETDWETLSGRQTVQLSGRMSQLPTGTYLARLTANGQNVMNQLMIFQSR
jgi:PA14 domain